MTERRLNRLQSSILRLWPNTGANRTEIEKDGFIALKGDATGYRDENFSGAVSAIGPNAATFVNWDSTGILIPAFPHNVTKELQFVKEYDHQGKEMVDIVVHAHLYPTDTSAGTAKFFCEYIIKNDNVPKVTGTLDATATMSGVAWDEIRLNLGSIGAGVLSQGTQLGLRLYRLNSDAGTYAQPVAVSTWGYHWEVDTPAGSRGVTTK